MSGRATKRIGEYDATTGVTINANFINLEAVPVSLAVSGNSLFVVSGGTVAKYDATTGG